MVTALDRARREAGVWKARAEEAEAERDSALAALADARGRALAKRLSAEAWRVQCRRAWADRDQARNLAVALEQELAERDHQ